MLQKYEFFTPSNAVSPIPDIEYEK